MTAAAPRPRVAFVSQPWNRFAPPVQNGSIAIWTYEVARRLIATHDVAVYARQGPDEAAHERSADNLECHRVSLDADLRVLRLLRRGAGSRQPWFASRWSYRGFARAVARDLQRRGCDVVHVHNFSQFLPVLRRRLPRAKIVLHMHCEWLSQLNHRVIRRRLRAADLVLGCSDYIAATIRRAFPAVASRCYGLHNGADVARFAPDPGDPAREGTRSQILFVGRVSPEKGAHVLVEAFRRVLDAHPDATLRLVGPVGAPSREFVLDLSDDPQVRALEPHYRADYATALTRDLPAAVAQRIEITGPAPNTALVNDYRQAAVFAAPSVWHEPFGIPLVEAMASGCPTIGTDGGGMPEIIEDGATGYLVPRADPDALARRLIELLGDAPRRAAMGHAARERAVAHFSWDRIAAELASRYEALARQRS
ncbi:MAG: glycosyltransferase family 4 protein [Planctomycetota bacterium]